MKVVRFACVGSIGFLVDVATMFFLSFYIAAIPARGIAFWTAASSNWWLNRKITFNAADKAKPMRQWGYFLATSCIGFIPNWGCYWLLMQFVDTEQLSAWLTNQSAELSYLLIKTFPIEITWPFISMIPGVLLGMLTNYLLADRWVFHSAAT